MNLSNFWIVNSLIINYFSFQVNIGCQFFTKEKTNVGCQCLFFCPLSNVVSRRHNRWNFKYLLSFVSLDIVLPFIIVFHINLLTTIYVYLFIPSRLNIVIKSFTSITIFESCASSLSFFQNIKVWLQFVKVNEKKKKMEIKDQANDICNILIM